MKNLIIRTISNFIKFCVPILLTGLVLALPVFLLWNSIIPDVFGLKEISFLQAIGLNLLSGFLIKSTHYNPVVSKETPKVIVKKNNLH